MADIGEIHVWNPGVESSHVTTEADGGLGSARYCDLGEGTYLHENVVSWDPPRKLTMRITDTNLPYRTADIRFTLRPEDGKTNVTVSPQYELKFGIIGKVLDALYVRRVYERGMEDLLSGLKRHVEQVEK